MLFVDEVHRFNKAQQDAFLPHIEDGTILFVGATTDVATLFAVNWLHALSFAATYLGAIRALERRVPAAQRATAQGLLGAATSGGGMVFCGLCGGVMFEHVGAQAYYLMAGFALVGAVSALWLRRAQDAQQAA